MDDILPTFLLEAESLLQEGKARESAVLCTRGLVKYPMYKTAYIVLLRALNELGDTTQVEEVYDEAPNFVKYNQTVQYMMDNLGSVTTKKSEKIIEQHEGDELTNESEKARIEPTEGKDLEVEIDNSHSIESNEELDAEISDELKNDELSPEMIETLTKSGDVDSNTNDAEQETTELKETLTLAKIYEQQDAYQKALAIYLMLQEAPDNEDMYADKIVELKAIIEEERE